MTDDLEIYLTSCQVGITASSIAVGIIAEPALAAIFEPYFESSVLAGVGVGGAIAFLLINLVHLTHGEQTPTYLGVERARFVCRYGATPLYNFARVTRRLSSRRRSRQVDAPAVRCRNVRRVARSRSR